MKTYSRKNSSYLKKAFIASNFNEMCRLCLSEVDMVLTPIIQDNKICYQEWIHYSVDVLVEEGDGLPPNICVECLATVEQMYLFKKKCKTSDSKLREHLEMTELNQECKLSSIGFNDTSDSNLFQKEKSRPCDVLQNNTIDSEGVIESDEKSNFVSADVVSEQSKISIKCEVEKCKETQDLNTVLNKKPEQQGKTIIKEVTRYILKGEKKEDGQEDLTVCEVVPLVVRSDKSVQYVSENSLDSDNKNGFFKNNNLVEYESSSKSLANNQNAGGRIQEICKLWGYDEESEEIQKNEEDGSVLNSLQSDYEKNSVIKNVEMAEINLEQNGVKTHKVYMNKNHIEISEAKPVEKSFNKCFICTMGFTSYLAMKEHLLKTHKDVPDTPFCEICGKNFTCTNSLKRHMTVHTGVKPYKCKVCGRKFSQGSILKRHLLTHENLKPYNCHFCQKSYTQKINLLTHMKNHGLKIRTDKFICKLCNKSFVHQSGLSRHVKVHKGVRFMCLQCTKTFGDASALARHVKAVC